MSNHTKLGAASKVLMILGLCWIVGGGAVALAVGIQSIAAGYQLYGIGSLFVGGTVLFSSWFMWRQL